MVVDSKATQLIGIDYLDKFFISISANGFCGLLFSFTSQNVRLYSGNIFK